MTSDALPPSPFTTILNFRDVGQTINTLTSRKLLHTSLLFRSARLDEASPAEYDRLLTSHKLRTIVDLRSNAERAQAEERRLQSVTDTRVPPECQGNGNPRPDIYQINLSGGPFIRALLWRLSWKSLARFLRFMAQGNRDEAIKLLGQEVLAPRGLVGLAQDTLDYSQDGIGRVFHILANSESYPVLLHCTQGKDRTGLVIILLLRFLATVDMSAIEEDYRISERELQVDRSRRLAEIVAMGMSEDYAACPAGFVTAVTDYIDQHYGSVTAYLLNLDSITPDTLKKIKQILSHD